MGGGGAERVGPRPSPGSALTLPVSPEGLHFPCSRSLTHLSWMGAERVRGEG